MTTIKPASTVRFHAAQALLPQGWAQDVRIDSVAGRITAVVAGEAWDGQSQRLDVVVPGLGNLHSHAFQRAYTPAPRYRREARLIALFCTLH